MAVKKKDGENLSAENITKVIGLLESEFPITKKVACEILNISYNTTRLTKIIEEFKETASRNAELRKKMRNVPFDLSDKKHIISEYLNGSSLTEISDSIYRTIAKVKSVLREYNVPLRVPGSTYQRPALLPDESICKDYISNDLVYSARYDCPAIVVDLHGESPIHGNVYKLWLLGDEKQFAYQPYYELGSLTKIQKELGITL